MELNQNPGARMDAPGAQEAVQRVADVSEHQAHQAVDWPASRVSLPEARDLTLVDERPSTFITLPACLQYLEGTRRFVCWLMTHDRNPRKLPVNVRGGEAGRAASTKDPTTWATLAEAKAALARGGLDGIGLQLLNLPCFGALDLDNVRDPETGDLLPWVAELVARSGSYTEVTPSGKGLRILGSLKEDFPAIQTPRPHPQGGKFEVYANLKTGRYITVTGARLPEAPDVLAPLDDLIRELLKEKEAVRADPGEVRDVSTGDEDFLRLPETLRTIIAYGQSGDRSVDFQSAVNGLFRSGASFEASLSILQAHPDGPAQKYIEGKRLEKEFKRSWDKAKALPRADFPRADATSEGEHVDDDDTPPVDLWGTFPRPELPRGLLPRVIEEFALTQGRLMGADPAGLVMAALVVCAAALPDRVKLQVKRYDPFFLESARLWGALVGLPSTKKSPIISRAVAPLRRLDADLFRKWRAEMAAIEQLPSKERKAALRPPQRRLRIEDTTVEAAQEVLADNPDGVLCLRDELTGWFGAMEKYNSSRGAGSDRAFYLEAYNGGSYALNRVHRGATMIDNLSISMLGGVQPGPIRKIASEAADDGLIQRFIPIVLREAVVDLDEAQLCDSLSKYDAVVQALVSMRSGVGVPTGADFILRFDDAAQALRQELAARHVALSQVEAVSPKLAAHIGKYDGLFARLALLFHCIEHAHAPRLPDTIGEPTARRAADFLHKFLLPHARAFYAEVLELSDNHDVLKETAGHILAHRLDEVTHRMLSRGGRKTRAMTRAESTRIMEQLESLAWVDQVPPAPHQRAERWRVRPIVHRLFTERAAKEAERRAQARAAVLEAVGSAADG